MTEQAERLKSRLASVKHTVAVMSGKGGVGKSSVTVNLAAALAMAGHAVGILDADLNGASVARMTGVGGRALQIGAAGVVPPEGALGLKVMSIDLLLRDEAAPLVWDALTQKDAFAWRGLMEMGAVRELLSDTAWGSLDYLLIDLPPGTDKLPNLVDVLPHLSGALILTIPSQVSQFVVGKSIKIATGLLKAPVIGLVENMATYVCPCCGAEEALFPGGHVERLAADHGVPYLGKIPFDPRMAAASDEGVPFQADHADTPAGRSIQRLAKHVRSYLDGDPPG